MASVRKRRRLAFEFLASTIQEGHEERQPQQVYESFMRIMALEWGASSRPRFDRSFSGRAPLTRFVSSAVIFAAFTAERSVSGHALAL